MRTHLLMLAAVALLPILAVSAQAVREALTAYRHTFDDGLLSASRALAAAVEREFVAQTVALETLASNPLLDLDPNGGFVGLAGFYERAVRAATLLGSPVRLVGVDGTDLLDSAHPFGADLATTGARDPVESVIASRRPRVGDLSRWTAGAPLAVPVLVPVEREGRIVGVLGSPLTPERLSRVLAAQGLGTYRFATLFDATSALVARSSHPEIGRAASEWFVEAVAGRTEGILEGWSATIGTDIVLAFKRLDATPGWVAVVGEPRAASDNVVRRPLLALVFGGSAILLLAIIGAGWIAGRVLRDVRMLEMQAQNLSADAIGHPPAHRTTAPAAVAEFADLYRAMSRAGCALRDREERQALLVREVDHRSKNALAVVQALVRLTTADDQVTFRRVVQGRVDSLARTHSTLAQSGWRAAELRDLLDAELSPHLGAISLSGPPVSVSVLAAQPIAMVIHELATNAVKYGALSVPGGTVRVLWSLKDGQLHLRWEELDGPPVSIPARRGFGSRMIEANVRGQLGGVLRVSWGPFFACDIIVPIERVVAVATGAVA